MKTISAYHTPRYDFTDLRKTFDLLRFRPNCLHMVLEYLKNHSPIKSLFNRSRDTYGAKSPNISPELSPFFYTDLPPQFDEQQCNNKCFEISTKKPENNLMSSPNETTTPTERPNSRRTRTSTIQQRKNRAVTASTKKQKHSRLANTSNREHIFRNQNAVSKRLKRANDSAPAFIVAPENPVADSPENPRGILLNKNTQQTADPINPPQSSSSSINTANLRPNTNRQNLSGIIRQPVLNIPNLSSTLIRNAISENRRISETVRDIRNEERLWNRPNTRLSTESSETSEGQIEPIEIDENFSFDFQTNLSETSSESETEGHTETENENSEAQSIHSFNPEMALPAELAAEITRAMHALTAKVNEIDERTRRFENRLNNDQNANNPNENGQNANQRNNNEQNEAENNHEQNREPIEPRQRQVREENLDIGNLIQILSRVPTYNLPSLTDANDDEITKFIRAANFYYDSSASELEDERLLTKIKEKAIICTWIPERQIQDAQNWPQIKDFLESRAKRENGPERLKARVRDLHQLRDESMIDYVKRTEDLLRAHESYHGPALTGAFKYNTEDQIRDAFERGISDNKIKNIIHSRASTSLEESTAAALRLQSRQEEKTPNTEIVCAYCGKVGHRRAECFSHKKDIQKSEEAAMALTAPFCTSCRIAGHTATTCYVSRRTGNNQQTNANRNNNRSNQNYNNNYGGARPRNQQNNRNNNNNNFNNNNFNNNNNNARNTGGGYNNNNSNGNNNGNNQNNGNGYRYNNNNNNQNNGYNNRYNNNNQNNNYNNRYNNNFQNNGNNNRYNNNQQTGGNNGYNNNRDNNNGYNNGYNNNRNTENRQAYYTVNPQPQSSINPSAPDYVPSRQFYPSAPQQNQGN